ncbi:MAG: hypothetical protein HZC37_26170 [Burkholderiales bacterium]|nr:hypothetical protein [Burkholderiales bacterium]
MRRTLALLATTALSLAAWMLHRRRQRQRLAARPRAKPEVLQRWEGEGGALPEGGPGITVSPVLAKDDAVEDGAAEATGATLPTPGKKAAGTRATRPH